MMLICIEVLTNIIHFKWGAKQSIRLINSLRRLECFLGSSSLSELNSIENILYNWVVALK